MHTAQDLFDQGYRTTSRKYRHVSRVDISDDDMMRAFVKENFGHSRSGVAACSLEQQRDFYRRCISKDSLTLDKQTHDQLLVLEGRKGGLFSHSVYQKKHGAVIN